MRCIAAYDFGTSGVKVALVSDVGEILAIREHPYPLLKPRPLYVEQRPEEFWEAVCDVTHKVLEDAGVEPECVKGLNFSVQAVTLIPVDADGNVLYNAISWLDGRAEKQAQAINEKCGAPLVRSQDFQPRLLWLKENEPEIYEKTAWFLECDGYLQYRSTGIMAVPEDHPGILRNTPDAQAYLDATLQDVDRSKLPPTVQACKEFGVLDASGAAELGLKEGTPVFGGMVDVPAAAAGCCCIHSGDAHVYLGSSGWLSVLIDQAYDAAEGSYQIASIDPDLQIYGGCVNSCCMMLDYAIDLFYAEEHKQLGGGIYDLVNAEVDKIAPGCDGLFATPWLNGEQFPIPDSFVRAMFFNISSHHTRAHFIAAVMESICFSLRGQIDLYKEDTGLTIKKVGANGGGSLSPQWMQMMANVLQMPVAVPDESRHSGAVGAAFATAVGLGWCEMDEIGEFIKIKNTYYPDKSLAKMYKKRYRTYQTLYNAIRGLSRELNEE